MFVVEATLVLYLYFILAVQRFFRGKRKDVGSGLRNLDQAIEQILINIQWKKANEKTINDWISKRTGTDTNLDTIMIDTIT